MLKLDAFQRASFYVSIHIFFERLAVKEQLPTEVMDLLEGLGVGLPSFTDEELEKTSEYIRSFRASDVRLDLHPAARTHLPFYIKSFIEAAGYTAPEPVDNIISMTAFAARLAIDIYTEQLTDSKKSQKLERLLHRFVKTHIMPALNQANPQNKSLLKTIQSIARVLEEDCSTLLKLSARTG